MSGGNGEATSLLWRFVAGEEGAFEEIFRQHSGWVFRRCLAMVGNREDAEDLTQDVFLTLYQKRRLYRGDCSLGLWLRRICDSRCIDFLRRRGREGRMLAEYRDMISFNRSRCTDVALDDPEADPSTQKEVRRALAALPEKDRLVLVLHYLEGRSYTDIAQELGWSAGRVKVTVHRAKEKFRHVFERLTPYQEQPQWEECVVGSSRS